MNSISDRLIRCFLLVFPNLSPDEIPAAAARDLNEWDSLAHVNLLSVICEEFGIDIDFAEFGDATSFSALLDRLRELTAHS
jgi:acyl carrier protein